MDGPESTLVPGYRLDRYELLCPIASGGMASVWLARLRGKRGFEKLFAIKTIKTELISDAHFQEMFLDEARIHSRIIHPNVAQILELGEQNDILYIVMEYVDGDSLAKINRLSNKRGSPLPPNVSMRVVADMCAGLHAAHQLKDAAGESLCVVHRDVSPQNVLVTTSGQSKVIDFGLVKAKNRTTADTQSGVVKGKIRYMAPEQVGGTAIDHRADVWAAGMCLYELITGLTPYHDEDDLDVVKRLMSADPLPRFHVALPPQIEKILLKAIVKDPEGRFASCGAMRRAIESAIHELALTAEADDVAEFIEATLPELASKRQKTIGKALVAAEERGARPGSVPPPSTVVGPRPAVDPIETPDMAFAATEVSARDKLTSDAALPLTRKRAETERLDSDPAGNVSSYGRTPSATTLRDQLGERRRRGGLAFWIAAFAVASAGAFILWPRESPPSSTPTTAPSISSATPVESGSTAVTDTQPAPSASSLDLDAPVPATPPMADAAAATAAVSATPSRTASGHRPLPSSTPPTATPYDGGLSPGARSAAAIMLAPKPTETPPPEEPKKE
jgi:serine/threonine protein kinase